MYLSRGQRIKLSELSDKSNFKIKITIKSDKNAIYDISCFGLDETDKCSDEKYLIFYNQKKSPCNSIILLENSENNTEIFEINISKVPNKIKKLVFSATVDGIENMSQIKESSIFLFENNELKGGYKFSGSDFNKEKSIMVAEIYLKNEWRFSAVGQGFNGGLSALLKHFGVEEEKNEPLASVSINNKKLEDLDIKYSSPQQEKTIDKPKISTFLKDILLSPFKYGQNKVNEKTEHNEKKLNERKFNDLLNDYLSDGILSKEEMNSLESFCKDKKLNLDDCLIQSQYSIERFLHVLLADIVSDNIITEEEEVTINSVCHFLKPSYRIQEEIKETIKRVKLIEKIRIGDIKPISEHNIITKINELVWYLQTNINLIRELKRESKAYKGSFFITSERLIFISHEHPLEIPLKNILNTEVDGSSFFIVGKKSTYQFKLNESDLLEAYVEQALNKFYRKLNIQQTSTKTRTIPQNVKSSVWLRDEGKCIECNAQEYLEFDHIIPFSKGGSNSINNIQLLCRKCNLSKSDNI